MPFRFLIVGAGFSGSVLARELVDHLDCFVEIREERNHIAGNCHTYVDEETGITVHHYGPHIFNTDKKEIWDYFNHYSELRHYVHQVKAWHDGKVYSLPINISTLNQFFDKTFTPESAREFLNTLGDHSILHPDNFEEQAIRLLGEKLYKAFFYGYTKKQWGCEPRLLPASILKRLPIRFDYNDNYHNNPYTGIPVNGYTDFVSNLLDHRRIKVVLNKKFLDNSDELSSSYDHIFYTGSIDSFFNYEHGRLSYRTLRFEKEIHEGDFQGCPQINYCDENIPFTRITEHKYFTPWEKFNKTVIFKEYSSEAENGNNLFYPKRLKADKDLLSVYREKAGQLKNISFLGRLGTYRYLDMQHVIEESIGFAKLFVECLKTDSPLPVFPNRE